MAEFKHLLEAIVGTSGDGIISADAGGRITGWNSSAERILGYRPDEAVGQPLTFIVPERFRQRHTAGFALTKKSGETRGKILEVAALHKSGAEVPIELSLSTGHTEGEQFFSAIIRDITERKRAERELAEKEAQLRIALDSMPGGMMLGDRDLNYVLFNSQYSELYEFPDGLVRVGGSFRDELRYQADRGDFGLGDKDELIEQVVATYQKGEAVSYERAIAGSGRTLQVYVAPTPEGGYVTIVTDITERKRAERALQTSDERLRDAVDSLQGGFALYDAEDQLVLVNDQYTQINPSISEILERGGTFEDLLRGNVAQGMIAEAVGREEEFLRERLARHRNPSAEPIVRNHTDGRSYLLREVRTPEGGTVLTYSEITELKRAEEALRENQQLLATILNNMPAMVYLRDAEGRFKLVNRKYEEVHDVDNEKIRGKTLHEVFPKISADEYASLDAEVLKHHRVQEGEERHWLGEEERTHAVVKFPILDIAGDVVGVGGVDIDITERKRMEKALAEKEAQLRVALDNMPGGMALSDRDLNYLLFNSQYSELYEFPDGLVKVGGSIRDEMRFQADRGDFGPGDKDELVEQVVAIYQRGEAMSHEREIAGSGRTLQVYLAPTPEGGHAQIVTDITERKRAEEELAEKEAQLRVVMDNMPGGMALFDRDLNFVLFNSQNSELLEYPDGLVRVGKSLRDVLRYPTDRGDFGPGDKDGLIEQVIATYQTGEAVSYERAIAGSGRSVRTYVAPTPEGGYVNIVTDITDLKQAEQTLKQARDEATRATQAKSQFLASMSHELRTPLNAIIGFTRLVMRRSKERLEPKQYGNLEKVLSSAERLLLLINDILDLSKIVAGQTTIHPAEFAVDAVIDDCLRTVEPSIKSDRVRLVQEVESDLPKIFTDEDKVRQILLNLLSNAAKFTEEGRVTVRARRHDEMLVIEVADTGIGIPAGAHELIFEEFGQTEDGTTRQHSGTGLGLAIARHLAQLLGGDITVESTPGAGSTFTVTILQRYAAGNV